MEFISVTNGVMIFVPTRGTKTKSHNFKPQNVSLPFHENIHVHIYSFMRDKCTGCMAFESFMSVAHDDVIQWKHFPRYWPFVRGRPVSRSFDIFFELRPNKLLSKQPGGWWFEAPSRPLWRHCNGWMAIINPIQQNLLKAPPLINQYNCAGDNCQY